ncbi:hypothetical protein EJD97_014397 [Solanum chilense]|uniref:DUF4283 domain-containing protein n=1 Tax=Solanum chilense TaxID=4083 RepID=A0A6N2BE73_SOLCI|nr:hypothetical protein EJD97_014397 [Solanum chilense]
MEGNTMYYNVGFKSFDITKCSSGADSWWRTDASKKALLHTNHDNIRIVGGSVARENDLLSRCLFGKFQATQKLPTLNDVRRWACNTWKNALGVNVFSMNDGQFLFELPSKKMAEHVQSGEWIWKKMKLGA